MSRSIFTLGMFTLAFPIMIEGPSDSGGGSAHETRVSVGGGVGYYALIARDCEGNTIGHQPVSFREAGADLEQQLVGPLHVGLRGGLLRDKVGPSTLYGGESATQANRYVNPYVSLEGCRPGSAWDGSTPGSHSYEESKPPAAICAWVDGAGTLAPA